MSDIDRRRFISAYHRSSDHDVLHEHAESIRGYDILLQCVIEEDLELGDMEHGDREEILAEIEAGNLCEFSAIVTCSQLGQLLSEDHLGSCIYKTYEEFYTDHRDHYYMDMIDQCISGAEDRIYSLKGIHHD